MDERKLTRIVKIVTCIATSFVFLLVAIIVAEYVKIASLNKKIDNVTQELDNIAKTQQELEEKQEQYSSSVFIEDYARRELGMLDENEKYIIFE